MSVPYYGDFADNDTVNIPFNTFSSDDPAASVTATDLVLTDIYVHKDGSATAITVDGATIDVDAPGVGAHMVTIDTNADAAYVTGSEYAVRVDGVTVDGGTINAWIGAFSIERAGGALALIKVVDAVVDKLNLGIIYGLAQTGTLSTTACTTDLSGYVNDELIGREIVFTGGTADGQAATITDYASANGLVTFTGGITTAPANNDTIKIV